MHSLLQNETTITTFIKFHIDQLQVGVWPRMGGVYLFWIKHLDFDKLTPAHFGGNAGGQRTIWNGIETWITLAFFWIEKTPTSDGKHLSKKKMISSCLILWSGNFSLSFPHCPRDWHVDSDALTLDLGGFNEASCKKETRFVWMVWIFLKHTLEVQPPFFIGWFPNHHYFSRGLSSSKKEPPFFQWWLTSRDM